MIWGVDKVGYKTLDNHTYLDIWEKSTQALKDNRSGSVLGYVKSSSNDVTTAL